MPKKQNRKVSISPSTANATSVPARPTYTSPASLRRVGAPTEFKPDYSRVIADLKRIAALAASFFAILVVLSFFLR